MTISYDSLQLNPERLRAWAPVPLRLALGIALIIHGGIKLFVPGGHENIAYLAGRLGMPFADAMGWLIGAVECFGGLGILLGALFPISTALNGLNIGLLLVLGGLAGAIPEPLPGGDPLPQFREAFIILGGTIALFLSGPGRLAIDAVRHLTAKPPET